MALSISLTWQHDTNCDGYTINRYATGAPGTFTEIARVANNVLAYADADSALVGGQQYQYRVAAFNASNGSTVYSTNASVTITATLPTPDPVTNLTATIVH